MHFHGFLNAKEKETQKKTCNDLCCCVRGKTLTTEINYIVNSVVYLCIVCTVYDDRDLPDDGETTTEKCGTETKEENGSGKGNKKLLQW